MKDDIGCIANFFFRKFQPSLVGLPFYFVCFFFFSYQNITAGIQLEDLPRCLVVFILSYIKIIQRISGASCHVLEICNFLDEFKIFNFVHF